MEHQNMTIIEPNEVRASACKGHNDTLTILSGPYEGLQFRYDTVWLDDKEPEKGIQFHYSTLNGEPLPEDKEDFEHAIAYMLHKQYWENVATGNLVFSGGLDSDDQELIDSIGQKVVAATQKIQSQVTETKSIASQIMQKPGVFSSQQDESAASMLDRIAAEGMAAMKGRG
jgi:hypothetical protein